jgi:hypothetical protein
VAVAYAAEPGRGLPIWHLGGAGALHRRDIYEWATTRATVLFFPRIASKDVAT